MKIRTGLLEDSKGILDLDKKAFPEEWIVEEDFVEKILSKNKRIYRVLEEDGILRGHYCFFPLKKENYEKLLNGEIEEKDIYEYVVDYTFDKKLYLYGATVMVDVEVEAKERRIYAEELTKDIPFFVRGLIEEGFQIEEIGSIAITKVGNYFCRKVGMKKSHTINENGMECTVYRLKIKEHI